MSKSSRRRKKRQRISNNQSIISGMKIIFDEVKEVEFVKNNLQNKIMMWRRNNKRGDIADALSTQCVINEILCVNNVISKIHGHIKNSETDSCADVVKVLDEVEEIISNTLKANTLKMRQLSASIMTELTGKEEIYS